MIDMEVDQGPPYLILSRSWKTIILLPEQSPSQLRTKPQPHKNPLATTSLALSTT